MSRVHLYEVTCFASAVYRYAQTMIVYVLAHSEIEAQKLALDRMHLLGWKYTAAVSEPVLRASTELSDVDGSCRFLIVDLLVLPL